MSARRRRGLLLLAVALASGGLAASEVHEHERRAAEQLGPSVDVLAATRDLRTGAQVTRDSVGVRRVPVRFAPPDALPTEQGVVGARPSAPIPSGGYVTASAFESDETGPRGSALRRGERAVTVEVSGGSTLAELRPGSRVDVLVSTETGTGGGRTTMALAGAELLRLGEGGGSSAGAADDAVANQSSGPSALATLRVALRQAIYLTAADNFASEIRLLPRPPGDRSPAGGSVSQGQL